MRETIEAIRVLGFWRVVFYRTLYRPLMRLAHRYNWHYAPPIYPDLDTMLWCHWCGLRYVVPDTSGPLRRTVRETGVTNAE